MGEKLFLTLGVVGILAAVVGYLNPSLDPRRETPLLRLVRLAGLCVGILLFQVCLTRANGGSSSLETLLHDMVSTGRHWVDRCLHVL